MDDIVIAIIIEQVKLSEEAQLVTVPDIGVVFVHWPEEAIFFGTAASVESVAYMCCEKIVSSTKMCCQIVADVLDGAMIIRPYNIDEHDSASKDVYHLHPGSMT
jgi:hypothetical protein